MGWPSDFTLLKLKPPPKIILLFDCAFSMFVIHLLARRWLASLSQFNCDAGTHP
jgi:hypothetical protein